MSGPRIRRFGTFSGGIDLPDDKESALNTPINAWEQAPPISLPLGRSEEHAASTLVKVDQKVAAGELLASGRDEAPDIFAPAEATVTGFSTVEIASRRTMHKAPAIDLQPAATIDLPPTDPIEPHWSDLDEAALWDRITEGQLSVHRDNAEPLTKWVLRARSKSCSLIVANAMEQQPLVTANHRLLVEYGHEVAEGLAILTRAAGADEAALVVPRRRTDAYRRLAAPAGKYNITQVALSHKYPTEADVILVKVLTRRSAPPGMGPMDVQVAVIDPATCFAVYRWVACRQRLPGRIVTVSGAADHPNGNYFLPFGARCLDVINSDEHIVIHGGPMIGTLCSDDTVVTPATDAILSITPTPRTPPSPCIRCGWCTDHCPARLNVAALNDDFELAMIADAIRSCVSACVGCGVCSYVCPARLPLAQRVAELKLAAHHALAANNKGDK